MSTGVMTFTLDGSTSSDSNVTITVGLDVTLEAGSSQWHAKTLSLSPYGVKVASVAQSQPLRPGSSVRLRIPLPDQDAPLSCPAGVVRTDPDGVALKFGSLGDSEFGRVKDLVDSLLQRMAGGASRDRGGALPARPDWPGQDGLQAAEILRKSRARAAGLESSRHGPGARAAPGARGVIPRDRRVSNGPMAGPAEPTGTGEPSAPGMARYPVNGASCSRGLRRKNRRTGNKEAASVRVDPDGVATVGSLPA